MRKYKIQCMRGCEYKCFQTLKKKKKRLLQPQTHHWSCWMSNTIGLCSSKMSILINKYVKTKTLTYAALPILSFSLSSPFHARFSLLIAVVEKKNNNNNRYKITECSNNTPYHNTRTCPDFHKWEDRRRNPASFPYLAKPCPQVCSSSGRAHESSRWRDVSNCSRGDECSLCHTFLEYWLYIFFFCDFFLSIY